MSIYSLTQTKIQWDKTASKKTDSSSFFHILCLNERLGFCYSVGHSDKAEAVATGQTDSDKRSD